MSYWFVGSPYSLYEGGLDAAAAEVARVMGDFAKAGIAAFSPIVHTHEIAKANGIDPCNHGIWLRFNEPMMAAAKGLVVVKMAGWQDSRGLRHEIAYFLRARKPIRYLDPALLNLNDDPLRQSESAAA